MIEKKLQGFVVSRTNYSDNDVILNVLTKDGFFSFKARGILKTTSKNAPACNFFVLSDFILQAKSEKGHYSLKSASIVKMYHKPYDDLLVSACFLFLCNLFNQISESINPYNIAIDCFNRLENNEYPIMILNIFLKNLLNDLGYTPYFNGCIHCNKKTQLLSFSFEDGGFICFNCFDVSKHKKYSPEFLKSLYEFYLNDKTMSDDYALILFKKYTDFILNEVGLILNGLDFIYKCL